MSSSARMKFETESSSLFYVYCIVPLEVSPGLGTECSELGFSPVYFIPYKDIAAVVSKVPESEFGQREITGRVKNLEWLGFAASSHESVIEKIMYNKATPIPMKFCTIFNSEKKIVDLLRNGYASYRVQLDQIASKVEVGVVVYISDSGKESTQKDSTPVSRLRKKIDSAKPGAAYFLKQDLKSLEMAELNRKALLISKNVFRFLTENAVASAMNHIETARSGSAPAGKRTILNAAFLVEKAKIESFRKKARQVGTKYPEVRLKVTGPWPPYNFCA